MDFLHPQDFAEVMMLRRVEKSRGKMEIFLLDEEMRRRQSVLE